MFYPSIETTNYAHTGKRYVNLDMPLFGRVRATVIGTRGDNLVVRYRGAEYEIFRQN